MYKWESLGIQESAVACFNLVPVKANLLPLLPPHAATAAEVNTLIFPYSCQTGVCVSGGKVMKRTNKWNNQKFSAIFSKIQLSFVTLLEKVKTAPA